MKMLSFSLGVTGMESFRNLGKRTRFEEPGKRSGGIAESRFMDVEEVVMTDGLSEEDTEGRGRSRNVF